MSVLILQGLPKSQANFYTHSSYEERLKHYQQRLDCFALIQSEFLALSCKGEIQTKMVYTLRQLLFNTFRYTLPQGAIRRPQRCYQQISIHAPVGSVIFLSYLIPYLQSNFYTRSASAERSTVWVKVFKPYFQYTLPCWERTKTTNLGGQSGFYEFLYALHLAE